MIEKTLRKSQKETRGMKKIKYRMYLTFIFL